MSEVVKVGEVLLHRVELQQLCADLMELKEIVERHKGLWFRNPPTREEGRILTILNLWTERLEKILRWR